MNMSAFAIARANPATAPRQVCLYMELIFCRKAIAKESSVSKGCGRKPLDPTLPREVIRHELTGAERICPHDAK
jgi:hypothetical protein